MSQCPHCQAPILEDFGLIVCSSCGESVMMGMNGETPEAPEMDGLSPPQEPPVYDSSPTLENKDHLYQEEPSTFDDSQSQISNYLSEELLEGGAEAEEVPFDLEEASSPEIENDFSEEDAVLSSPPTEASMRDVVDFANQEQRTWSEGNIQYDVTISNIDSKELRVSLKVLLSDPLFMWDSVEIMSSVDKGKLHLKGLSAVKAAVLVRKIKPLPLEVKWEQNVLQKS